MDYKIYAETSFQKLYFRTEAFLNPNEQINDDYLQ